MNGSGFPKRWILWIEDQYQEYDPLLADLQGLVGPGGVVVARTADEGRSLLREQRFDLVLLDLMLPENQERLDHELVGLEVGIQLLRELRENADWKTPGTCNVVVVTARGNPHALAEVNDLLGSSGHLLRKPLVTETIARVVADMLSERHDSDLARPLSSTD